ncbi:hypothetical protein [Reinekea sp. G2M2-21]|uniref:hypothetical protein n=1 Tax=Reinekea sp. G2M2-21 TaxID=2788942 RepID=UPI0018AAB348|nr:hypothetical protein [Reinekea sp. G2M2-21]
MLPPGLLISLKANVLSIFDQLGCQVSCEELVSFLNRVQQLSTVEIGHHTYVVSDAAFDPQTIGIQPSYVVMLRLDAPALTSLINGTVEWLRAG